MKNKIKIVSHILSGAVLGVLLFSNLSVFAYVAPLPPYTAPNDIQMGPNLPTSVTLSGSSNSGSHIATPNNFKDLVNNIIVSGILTPLVYLLVGLAVLVFVYGVFKFIKAEGEEKQSGREFMIWGIIGIFVMISVWGLVAILQNTFNLSSSFSLPTLN
jgi:membrane-associated HD superfamily phosphohydrolase